MQATGACVLVANFIVDGVGMDRGGWHIHWFADSTVVWTGI